MATLRIGDHEITGDDETIYIYLRSIQAILDRGETRLVRLSADDSSTRDVLLSVGPGIPIRAELDRGDRRPVGVPLEGPRQARRRTGIITGA